MDQKAKSHGMGAIVKDLRGRGVSARNAKKVVRAVRDLWIKAFADGKEVELPVGSLQAVWKETGFQCKVKRGTLKHTGKLPPGVIYSRRQVGLSFRSTLRFEDWPDGTTTTVKKRVDRTRRTPWEPRAIRPELLLQKLPPNNPRPKKRPAPPQPHIPPAELRFAVLPRPSVRSSSVVAPPFIQKPFVTPSRTENLRPPGPGGRTRMKPPKGYGR